MDTEKPAFGLPTRAFRLLVVGLSIFVLFQFASLYLSWPKQAILGSFTLVIAIVLNGRKNSQVITLALMMLSIAVTLRYAWWRIHLVVSYFSDESNSRVSINSVLMLILLSAEAYTMIIMVLGYMQTSHLLQRKPIPLPSDEALWPHVDVLIPTYNEPLSLVRYTALAAINIDYPPDKLHVYILDDGSRDDFRLFAEEAGVGYITRKKHDHAKAGNINHALTKMKSPLITIFDCDHVPTRSFLQCTVGWFLVEQRLAMLQTPHFFYSPDPFERNLLQYKSIPNEGELFYGIIQDGNDFWNATFFCGSCAVLRRKALDEVGGIATETVTEDAHTSLRMQARGWNTAYINVAQAAGLATETLAAHVGQRVRWARGMIQILRTDNPLLARGMKLTQRLCYFNAMLHFMYAVPRLIFLVAPLAYMLFGKVIIPGYWIAILAYALPHLMISNLTNSRIQGRHRHSFWNEIYETVLAPYILLPTLLALVNPKLGSFNVTDKGTTLSETQFDSKIAAPTTWLLLFNLVGVLVAPYRLFVLDPLHPGTIISNLCWILFNMVILGVAAAVAHEQKQRRSAVRIPARIPILAQLADGRHVTGITSDMSVGGASIALSETDLDLQSGDPIRVAFPMQSGDAQISTTVVGVFGDEVRLQFIALTIPEQETLTRALYSRADSWINIRSNIEVDRPLLSLARVVRLSFTGFKQVLIALLPRRSNATPLPAARAASIVLIVLSCLVGPGLGAQSLQKMPTPIEPVIDLIPGSTPVDGAIDTRITLKDMGVQSVAELRGPHAYYSVHFTLPHTQLPRHASLKVSYHFNRSIGPHAGSIQVRLNNTPLADIFPSAIPQEDNQYDIADLPVSPDILIRDNDITFEYSAKGVIPTADKGKAMTSVSVGASSVLEIASSPIPFKNDLSLLPLPLFDSDLQTTTTIPFVFLSQPDAGTLQAAGIVASWFGVLAGSKPIRFTVSIGQIPPGNVVIFANKSLNSSATVETQSEGAALTIKTNPSDPTGSALILAGGDDDQLLTVARTLSMMKGTIHSATGEAAPLLGDSMQISDFAMPATRKADDAPRWLPSDRLVSLWNYSSQSMMQGDGSKPLPVYFRVPPDLYYGENQNLQLNVTYRYSARSIMVGSALRMFVNGALVNETPLSPGSDTRDGRRQVLLPVATMRPFGNTLLFNFDFDAKRFASGADDPGSELKGAILRNSSLDLRGLDHWAEMPNLELFANAGFPFTQLADLSQTVVVLPLHPSEKEIALFLHLMSHCGTQTGYPALRMEVAVPSDMTRADRDYLVLGTISNQPAFAALESQLPVTFDSDGIHVRQSDGFLDKLRKEWQRLLNRVDEDKQPSNDDAVPSAVIEGIQSPFGAGHSVVIVALRDDSAQEEFTSAFFERSQSSDVAHSVSLLRGGHFYSYALDTNDYHIGDISRYTLMRIWLAEYFWIMVPAVLLFSLVLGSWTHEYLKRRGAFRLRIAQA